MIRVLLIYILLTSLCFGNTDAKIKKLSAEIKSLDVLVELYYKRAQLYNENSSYDKALYDLKTVMALQEGYKDVKYQIARAYLGSDKPILALAFIDELLVSKSNPQERRAYLLLKADIFILQEQYIAGIKIYESQKKSKSGLSPYELTKLSSAYYEAGQSRKSLSILKNVLRDDANNYIIAEKMVEICIEETSYTLAHVMIERMLKHEDKRINTYYLQAKIYESEDKINEALSSSFKARENLEKLSKLKKKHKENKDLKRKILALELKLAEVDKS